MSAPPRDTSTDFLYISHTYHTYHFSILYGQVKWLTVS